MSAIFATLGRAGFIGTGACPETFYETDLLALLLVAVPPFKQQSFDLLFQSRKIVFDGAPDDFPIDVEIIVNHLVAHAAHPNPRQFRMT